MFTDGGQLEARIQKMYELEGALTQKGAAGWSSVKSRAESDQIRRKINRMNG